MKHTLQGSIASGTSGSKRISTGKFNGLLINATTALSSLKVVLFTPQDTKVLYDDTVANLIALSNFFGGFASTTGVYIPLGTLVLANGYELEVSFTSAAASVVDVATVYHNTSKVYAIQYTKTTGSITGKDIYQLFTTDSNMANVVKLKFVDGTENTTTTRLAMLYSEFFGQFEAAGSIGCLYSAEDQLTYLQDVEAPSNLVMIFTSLLFFPDIADEANYSAVNETEAKVYATQRFNPNKYLAIS